MMTHDSGPKQFPSCQGGAWGGKFLRKTPKPPPALPWQKERRKPLNYRKDLYKVEPYSGDIKRSYIKIIHHGLSVAPVGTL
jgi:hypothetical protein